MHRALPHQQLVQRVHEEMAKDPAREASCTFHVEGKELPGGSGGQLLQEAGTSTYPSEVQPEVRPDLIYSVDESGFNAENSSSSQLKTDQNKQTLLQGELLLSLSTRCPCRSHGK
ncbi:uncharacterized protein LOC121414728 [Lytechinus variegatus]|uniref:uncharacterized protein LOC121414728 n=1 Tax=Lytechinus variegatus TaxID=7654 RepID=UPI001BB0F838|nr:uncharacterized protein LOC121414728 [Lytechinus variegatus]